MASDPASAEYFFAPRDESDSDPAKFGIILHERAQQSRTRPRGRCELVASPVHGTYAPGNVVLRPEIVRAGQRALAAADPGGRFQYVFHGSSGSSERELTDAISFGVVKVNVDTDK